MRYNSNPDHDLHALAAVIARSQICVTAGNKSRPSQLPAGFDAVDVAILDWIVAQVRATPHSLTLM